MNLFKSIFGLPEGAPGQENTAFPWVSLSSITELDLLEEGRTVRPQVLFKHSTSCGLSRMMLRRFEGRWGKAREHMDFYFVDLIVFRELSDEIAHRYEVPHRSPQLLILDKCGVRRHASHGEIAFLGPEDILENPA